jgi:hypothetical protein
MIDTFPVIDCVCGHKNVALRLLGPYAEGLKRIYNYQCPHCLKLYPISIANTDKSVKYRSLRKNRK